MKSLLASSIYTQKINEKNKINKTKFLLIMSTHYNIASVEPRFLTDWSICLIHFIFGSTYNRLDFVEQR